MEVVVKAVETKKELKTFILLPYIIHKNHSNWVPPIYIDEQRFFNPKKNHSFSYCDTTLAIAWINGKAVGRIMGIIHRNYNRQHNENHARFCFIESWNDLEVFRALIDYVTKWAKKYGMVKLIGPLAFSDKDPQGFLIEGFNETISLAATCNFKYLVDLTEKEGFEKKCDLVVYSFNIPDTLPELHQRIYQRFKRNNTHLKIIEFTKRKELKRFIKPVFKLVNKTFADVHGFMPLTEIEMDEFASRYLCLINPRFVKVVVNEKDEPVSFIIGMSDLSKGFQKSKGSLYPFGIFYIFRAYKKSRQLNLLLGAVDPKYQGKGLDAIMAIKMIESAKSEEITAVDSHLQLENNTKVRAEMEKLGGKVSKRYRIYQKNL
ncbi:MAG: hypothetical protein ACOCWK_03415 [Tangfeifania sp.]